MSPAAVDEDGLGDGVPGELLNLAGVVLTVPKYPLTECVPLSRPLRATLHTIRLSM